MDQNRSCQVISSLVINRASEAIKYYKNVFGAKETYHVEQSGFIIHSEIVIGCTTIMITDEIPAMNIKSATTLGDTPIILYAYVDDVDETFERAIKFGGKIIFPVENQFYGDRMGAFIDPYGFKWNVAKNVRNVSMEELMKTMPDMTKPMIPMESRSDDFYKKKLFKYKTKYEELKNAAV